MKRKEFYALGIMSGTSVDGLDFSLVKSDGKNKVCIITNKYFKFSEKIKNDLNNLISNSRLVSPEKIEQEKFFIEYNKSFSDYLIKKIKLFFSSVNFFVNDVDVIGIHGNTLVHKPEKKISIQLGDLKLISKKIGKPVIGNFRSNDISLGGEGAPLVPIFHKAIFSKHKRKIMVVNIGGISNFTYLEGKKCFLASDIGPGNTLIDNFCLKKFNKNFDKNGLMAGKGTVNLKLVDEWLSKNIFKKIIPRSYDTENFRLESFIGKRELNFNNLRSLTFLSAKIISSMKLKLGKKIDYWIFSGGGVKNLTLMSDIKALLKNEKILISDKIGFDSSFVESSAFAYISIRTIKNLPSAFPETTGCSKKNVCGKIYNP